jgi:oligopeptidase B|tara:strand:+ start:7986 stop:10031 length:2046 start_codon:yes stop_codon:yes gene_type:complete
MKAQPYASPIDRFHRPEDPDWHWLENRNDTSVGDFLDAANAESSAWFAPLESEVEALYQGHLARRELAVTGLPAPLDHYTYWSETAADADYPRWWRHPLDAPSQRECFLDVGERAASLDFLEVGDMALSPNEAWLAWTEDTSGDEMFSLYLKSLPDGEPQLLLEGIGPELCWAEDDRTLLFTRYDDIQRPESIWRLDTAAPDQEAQLILREDDPEFWLGIGKTRSRTWLVLESASKDTSECYLLPALEPDHAPQCFRAREAGVEYAIEHRPGHFYVLNNREAPHFRLDVCPENDCDSWQPLIAHRDDQTLEGIDAFDWGLVITERDHDKAQVYLRVLELDASHSIQRDERLPLPEEPCSLALGDTPHFGERRLLLREESFTLPIRWLSHDLDTGERKLLKQQPVHGSLLPSQLTCQRVWAEAHDGERVPVSIVARADRLGQAPMPTLLYGYGAYGEVLDPWFSVARLELLERGIAFAVAHVRGGGDRGEPWYLAGKLEHKENSFRDFLAARDRLVEMGLSEADRVVAYGASAGGLLVGASLNLDPKAFCAAVLDVPFVDVLRTMENPDLPLTIAEYTEWGNPGDPAVRQRLKGYSPLDNLQAQPYPSVFLQGSWHDARVPYWEPAKLYARLRELDSARGPIILRTDMGAGHGGASGRFKAWHDNARQDAYVLWALGLAEQA